jgi:chromosome segregation ATPase
LGFAERIRNFIGAAPQSDVDALRGAMQCAAEARAAADAMQALVAEMRAGHAKSVEDLRAELTRLSTRVEAMPEMRAQLETFVHSLGRTMTGAADRLEQVDDRIERLEQQARAQTEIISLNRSEFDRQGRVLAGLESQMKSLEEAATRLAAVADRSAELLREAEGRRPRAERPDRTLQVAVGVLVVLLAIALLR